MNARTLLLIMNAAIAAPLAAQDNGAARPNRLAAIRHCLGAQASVDWFLDLEGEQLEVHAAEDRVLLILDRAPLRTADGAAILRPCILATTGTRLERIGEPVAVNDSVVMGRYLGRLGGERVLLEQYVRLRNGVLLARVMVVRKQEGSQPVSAGSHTARACALLNSVPAQGPVPAAIASH
jgi:hypothetical protein